MLLGDGQIFSGAMTPGGGITGTLSSGVSSREDNSNTTTEGYQRIVKATDGLTSQAITEAKKQLGPDAGTSAINKRASEILAVANEFKSKANPLDDAAIVSAGNTVARKYGKKHSDWIGSRIR
jgi:hypothetical protein